MSIAIEPASVTAQFRGICQRVLEFYFDKPERISQEVFDAKAKIIAAQLRKVLALPARPICFDEVTAVVVQAPGIEWGFIQQTSGLDKENANRVPGGAGAFVQRQAYRDNYRVFLHTGSKHIETQGPDLLATVSAAFEALKLPLPKGLPVR